MSGLVKIFQLYSYKIEMVRCLSHNLNCFYLSFNGFFPPVKMPQFIQKILLVIVLVQIALVLAKPYDEFYNPNDGTFSEDVVEKRASAYERYLDLLLMFALLSLTLN